MATIKVEPSSPFDQTEKEIQILSSGEENYHELEEKISNWAKLIFSGEIRRLCEKLKNGDDFVDEVMELN